MSESVETLAAMLLAAAIKEGRDDYIKALQNLVPVKNVLEQLKVDVFQFDETWRQRLLRTDYTSEEVRSMFSSELIKNPKIVDFIVEATNNVSEKSTKYSFIRNMLGAGLYIASHKAVVNLEDAPDFANWLATRTSHFNRANKDSFFYTIGEETAFSREAAVLFDKLNLEVPDSFDGNYVGSKKIRWSVSKFDAVVDWVSEICETPRVEVGHDGRLELRNPLLVRAFQEERKRIASKGEWHNNVFPRLVPILANKAASERLVAEGHIKLSPAFGFVGKSPNSGYFENKAEHGFVSKTHPELSIEHISGAMTFLTYEEITKLRAEGSKDSVFLIESVDGFRVNEIEQSSDLLRIAMRYHRPEFLCSRYEGNLYDFQRSGVGTRGYLRGLPVSSDLYGQLHIENEVLENPVFLEAFNSKQEMDYLREIHNPGASDPRQASIVQLDDGSELGEQVAFAIAGYKQLISKVGYIPAALFKGTQEFLAAFADELSRQGLEVSSCNTTRYTENPGTTSVNGIQRRLDARLGCLRRSEFKDLPVEELLTKGTRLKGEYDKEKICGILDRISVVELSKMAKTPAQRKFVIENFDVKAHHKDLPKAFRLAIGGQILEDDLGM